MDNSILWWFENDKRSSRERMAKNPEAPKWGMLQSRAFDQILAMSDKIVSHLEKENDNFFEARPFLTDDFNLEMRKKSGMSMGIRPTTEDKRFAVLVEELNRLWNEFEELEIKRILIK